MTSDVINEADNVVRRLRKHRFSVQECADELAERALKCGDVFDDNELIRIFVESLKDDIGRSVQLYWSTHRSIRMHAFIADALSIDTTNASRKREHGTQVQKNKGPSVSHERWAT